VQITHKLDVLFVAAGSADAATLQRVANKQEERMAKDAEALKWDSPGGDHSIFSKGKGKGPPGPPGVLGRGKGGGKPPVLPPPIPVAGGGKGKGKGPPGPPARSA
jgi:hypothetical protein